MPFILLVDVYYLLIFNNLSSAALIQLLDEDLTVFIDATQEWKRELKHAATVIQCAFRVVPKSVATSKLVLWKRLYQEKIKSVDEEE